MSHDAPQTDDNDLRAVRSIQRQLLQELSEPSGPTSADLADLIGHWPDDAATDPDVAGQLFQEFRNRSIRGEPISRKQQDFSLPSDSLASLFQHQDFMHSATWNSGTASPTHVLPKVGDELFGYRLRQPLGQGAFARVFLAEQTELAGRLVALKVSDLAGSEPQTLAQLQHTNIVPIYSVHEDSSAGIRAVCMPYFGGASLSQLLRIIRTNSEHPTRGEEFVKALKSLPSFSTATRSEESESRHDEASASRSPSDANHDTAPRTGEGRTPLEQFSESDYARACAWIVSQLARGLHHAHQRGVLHRDIKPSNVLLGSDGTPMLLDFNLAHDEHQLQGQVEATLGGTVAYMAPEHLRALSRRTSELIAQVDERSDLYGLGMVLFEMITGQNPFDQSVSSSPLPLLVEAMATERSRTIPSLRRVRGDVPWGLESIVRKCLQPDPEQRYQTAAELAEDLDRFLDDRPLRHAPELSRVEQVQKWVRRHPKLASSGLVTIAAVLLLALTWSMLLGMQACLSAAKARVAETEGAEARELARRFEQGVLKALCLVNTHRDLQEHSDSGRQLCEDTLALFDILADPNWQAKSTWKRLSEADRRKLAEDARELLLMLSSETSDPARAVQLVDRAAAIDGLPPSRAVWQAKADVLRKLGESDQADEAQRRADDIPRSTARDFYRSASAHLRSDSPERYRLAISDLEQALALDPRHYWSWMQKGLCLLEAGEPQRALADFGVCIGLWPEFSWGYFNRAFAFDRLGDKRAAVADYTAALERDPDLLAARQNRGLARLELGEPADALADFEHLHNAGRRDPTLQALRGQALEALHRSDEADAAFAIALNPEHLASLSPQRRHQLLCSYGFAVCKRRPAAAEQAFDRIPSDDPKYPEALYGRGLLAADANRWERATELFSQALELRPSLGEARRFRAILLARLGRFAEAVHEINTALQAAPHSGATLYAAACVTALAAEHAPNSIAASQAANESIRFLRQALSLGYGRDAATDKDLHGIRKHPDFDRLILQP